MTVKAAPAALTLAAVLLAVGLFLGFSPVSSGAVSCGSAFVASGDAMSTDYATAFGVPGSGHAVRDCADARSSRATVSWSFLIAGGVFLLVGAVARVQAKDAAEAGARSTA